MGKRDRPGRELKKPKKQPAKPVHHQSELTVIPTVEVVKRRRKHEEEESEE